MPTLVFDFETVPDQPAYSRLLGCSPEIPLLEHQGLRPARLVDAGDRPSGATGDFTRFGAPYDGYLKRYSEKLHRDLMDIQAVFRATTPLKLDEMAVLLGVPGKLDTEGSQVSVLYAAGLVDGIQVYCQHDVLTTAWVYRYLAVHRGWWSPEAGERFDTSVSAFLETRASTHWDRFRAAQDVI
jgi:predicted PolB exonuclease-like 3'-5' exonuclease